MSTTVSTVALSRVLPLHWWAAAVRKLPALSPISSLAASKYRAKMKSCFDGTACTKPQLELMKREPRP